MIPKQPTLQGWVPGLKVPSKTAFYGNIEEKDRNKWAVVQFVDRLIAGAMTSA